MCREKRKVEADHLHPTENTHLSNTQVIWPKLGTLWCTLWAQAENLQSSKVSFVPASRGIRSCLPEAGPDWRCRVTSHRPIHHPASPSRSCRLLLAYFTPVNQSGAYWAAQEPLYAAPALANQTDMSNPGWEGGRKNTAELSQIKSLWGLETSLLESAYSYNSAAHCAQAHSRHRSTAHKDQRRWQILCNTLSSLHIEGQLCTSAKPWCCYSLVQCIHITPIEQTHWVLVTILQSCY